MSDRDFVKIDRYERARLALEDLVLRHFHHNKAEVTDLDLLDAAVEDLRRLVMGEAAVVAVLEPRVAGQEPFAGGPAVDVPPVRRNKPPIAKPGRGRGWRPKGDGA